MKLSTESTVVNDGKLNTNIDNAQETADTATTKADNAQASADNAQSTANQAKTVADNTAQYFWVKTSGTDTGVHITETTQSEFVANPSGGNLLARSNGIAVRDGLTELASFGATKAQVGKDSTGHAVITANGMTIYGSNGNVELANLGYGEGRSETGTTADAPYYTFGIRNDDASVGNYSVAEGIDTVASGFASHAGGNEAVASGTSSFAHGNTVTTPDEVEHRTTASGSASHAEGYGTLASADGSHAEGELTEARAMMSHAEGRMSVASGYVSHAEGLVTTASGNESHAEGYGTVASGSVSHAGGQGTIASKYGQTAIGKFNVEDTTGSAAVYSNHGFIFGNGSDDDHRSNALAIGWNGDLKIKGNLYTNCNSDSSGGSFIQTGRVNVGALTANTQKEITVTYPTSYNSQSQVVLSPVFWGPADSVSWIIRNQTVSGFVLRVKATGAYNDVYFNWIAFGS